MAAPWEKYGGQSPEAKKPWDRYAPQQAPAAVPENPEPEPSWGQAFKNVGEGIAHLATGAVGGTVANAAGLGALGYDAIANAVMHPLSGAEPGHYADPTAVKEWVANKLVYQPTDKESPTVKAIQYPGKVFQGASEYLGEKADKTGIPYLGVAARALPEVALNLMGAKAAMGPKAAIPESMQTPVIAGERATTVAVPEKVPGMPEAKPEPPEDSPQVQAVKDATNAGIKLNPTQLGAKKGRAAAGMSGRAALDRELSFANVPVVDDMAKTAIGLEKGKHLNQANIDSLKSTANQAYADMAKTGVRKTSDEFRADINKITDRTGAASFAEDTPAAVQKIKETYSKVQSFSAKDAVAKIRQLRKDSRGNLKHDDPEKNALGYAQKQVADALEAELGRHAEALGMPELVSRYQAARVQLAKIHSVEDALEGTNVSARLLSRQQKAGVPLSGELKLIADTYDSFGKVLQDPSKIADNGPLSVVDYLVGVGGAAVNPALAAAVLARPAARRFLASDFYQRRAVPKSAPKPKPKTDRVASQKAAQAAAVLPQNRRQAVGP